MHVPLVHTQHLLLRPLTLHDAPAIFAYAHLPITTQFTSWKAHTNLADTQKFIHSLSHPNIWMWGITLKISGILIGECGFRLEEQTADVSCALAPSYWAQGIAKEALTHALLYVPASTRSINAAIIQENRRSISLFQHLHFQHRYTLPHHWHTHDTLHDVHIYTKIRQNLR